ncbi:DNA-binding transcriptional MerR regulator [Cryobacterium sp. MP_M5]|uniref:MerR family transcriptional regulator n=1 Tax=unclassified Cryobacterium TaxID=2649013 RepID=UPI0018CBCCE1|nr:MULTISPECIES: MerR family transcriptional regulator [unclassified Cryobacterium]MBG6057949.1 DNA-binding transcriptional MerR regulator [Cryobacterium sp. MP_M3]MEC5176148.1 DNA-binding transcriptional MerR regulator [Cryobacterium sp. MP_M5]
MKMSQLSAASDTPVATIKFYLRENLLPGGERSSPNQARYDAVHLRRIRLIHGLIDVGGLSVAAARRVIEAIDSELPLPETFEIAQRSVSADLDPATIDAGALARVDALLAGWRVSETNPGRLAAASVLETFEEIGHVDHRGWFAGYAAAALLVAEADLDEVDALPGREAKAETVVVGTVLGDALFSGLRRAAQEHVSSLRYSGSADSEPAPSPNRETPTTKE